MNVTQKFTFGVGKIENIVKKGENAGFQHFFLFLIMFSKGIF